MSNYYNVEELQGFKFKSIGTNVKISRNCSIYGSNSIEIGNNVRIDDFCILSGNIKLGNHIHIAAYSALFGGNIGIEMGDFSGLSSRVTIYASSDDYSGNYLTNPTLPRQFLNVISKKVVLEKHVIVGTNSTILPGVTISEGVAIGGMSFVNKNLEAWNIYAGIPAVKRKSRSKDLLKFESKVLEIEEKFKIGSELIVHRKVNVEDIEKFASASGDYNPIHVDEEYARRSIFGERIAHGMLTASFISAVIGNDFPGSGSIYLKQNLVFLNPVKVGDELEIRIRVKALEIENMRVELETNCYNQNDKCVLSGTGLVKIT